MSNALETKEVKKQARAAAKALREAKAAEIAKASPAAPKTPQIKSKRAMEIIAGASALASYLDTAKVVLDGFAYKTTKVPGLHVVRVPSVKEAFAKLPDNEEAKTFIQIIRDLADDVVALTKGSPKSTWVIRENGSANLMGLKI